MLCTLYRKGSLHTCKETAISVQQNSFSVAHVKILFINKHKNQLYLPPSFRSRSSQFIYVSLFKELS